MNYLVKQSWQCVLLKDVKGASKGTVPVLGTKHRNRPLACSVSAGGRMDIKESHIPYNGGTLWSCESGPKDALPILLCGGGPGCCDYLEPVANMIDNEYRVIRFEQRGCGRSTADNRYDLYTAVEDIERIRKHYGIERWVAGGHSWGANLALVYALTYPGRVIALLYIAGTGIHDNRHWIEEFYRNVDEIGEQLPDFAFPLNVEVNDEGNRTLREFGRRPDFYRSVSDLNVPALFVMAEKDIRPNWPAEQLANLMPNAKIVIIKDAAHYIWFDKADKLSSVLSGFLYEQSQHA